jgi:shikimate kinase
VAVRNVVLIGFMGTGKSAVGRALAERLGFRLFDTDDMVEREAGRSIAEIWADEGEQGFREMEYDAVLRACAGTGRVIACGGGAVLQIRNYGILKGAGMVVYLRAPADVLRARAGSSGSRPLLAERGAFDRLLAERVPAYESAADMIVDTDDGTPDEIAAAIEGQFS